APKRKVDPNKYFPWQLLSQSGYGNWYDTTNVRVPDNFNAMQSLRIIGYDVADSAAAVRAFKLHFEKLDNNSSIDEADKKIIYQLAKKY
ncbi:MAG TPA: hypothetical protein VKH37_01300, partial [Ferruginibacter sp.]|nr:hypothetical protein [Ferruginibacter sp.]